jgi:excisionase family DNA binding protein
MKSVAITTTTVERDVNSSDSPVGVAKRHGVGIATIYREIAKGALRARKLGRRTLITRDDEAAWLANMPVRGAAAETAGTKIGKRGGSKA